MKKYLFVAILLIVMSTSVKANEQTCSPTRTATLETVTCVMSGPTPHTYIQRQSPLENNQYHGVTQIFYPESVCEKEINKECIWQQQSYSNGKLNGQAKTYYPNGQVKEQINFVKGIPNGETALFNKEGKLITKSSYVNGVLAQTPVWLDQEGKPRQGQLVDSNELGNQHSRVMYKNGLKDGEEIVYEFDETKPRMTFSYKRGVKEGIAKIFNYKEGKQELAESVMYRQDKRNGIYQRFTNGKLSQENTFVNDVLEGDEKFYSAEGYLLSITPYVKGVIKGTRKIFYPNGKIKFADNYVNGRREGEMLYYDEKGKLIKKEMYKNNQLVN